MAREDAKSITKTLHGVNLSGWLIVEPWVTPGLFTDTGATDAKELMQALGQLRYGSRIAAHRRDFITEDDFEEIAERGFDAVRIPLPWHVFGSHGPMPQGYDGCLDCLDNAFVWANKHGLKVLLDLAETPESKRTPDGTALMVTHSQENRAAILDVVGALARRFAKDEAFLGIEPLDEVLCRRFTNFGQTDKLPIAFMRNYYREAYDAIRSAAGDKPVIVLSDCGYPGAWRSYMAHERYRNVWLDCHVHNHVRQNVGTGPAGARMLVEEGKKELARAKESGFPVMVGEWSAALPFGHGSMTEEGRIALTRVYSSGQLSTYEGCAAWFYQTWKTATHDAAWDARVALSSFDRDMWD